MIFDVLTLSQTTQSNRICFVQRLNIKLPNAFEDLVSIKKICFNLKLFSLRKVWNHLFFQMEQGGKNFKTFNIFCFVFLLKSNLMSVELILGCFLTSIITLQKSYAYFWMLYYLLFSHFNQPTVCHVLSSLYSQTFKIPTMDGPLH